MCIVGGVSRQWWWMSVSQVSSDTQLIVFRQSVNTQLNRSSVAQVSIVSARLQVFPKNFNFSQQMWNWIYNRSLSRTLKQWCGFFDYFYKKKFLKILTLHVQLHWSVDTSQQVLHAAGVDSGIFFCNFPYNQGTTWFYHVTANRKWRVFLRPRDPWCWIPVCFTIQDCFFSFVYCLFKWNLDKHRGRKWSSFLALLTLLSLGTSWSRWSHFSLYSRISHWSWNSLGAMLPLLARVP